MIHKGNSSNGCKACLRENLKCDRTKPRCQQCVARKVQCNYSLKLKWGGRPYKDKNKVINIPPNTRLVDGILVANHGHAPSNGATAGKTKKFVLVNEEMAAKNNSSAKSLLVSSSKQLVPLASPQVLDLGLEPTLESEFLPETQPEQDKSPSSGILIRQPSKKAYPKSVVHVFPSSLCSSGFDLLCNSWQYLDLFSFFINETSKLFTVCPTGPALNPYNTYLPQMAMDSPVLMKSLVFFGSKHKKQLCSHEEQAGCFPLETGLSLVPEYERLTQVLMDEISLELAQKLTNPRESLSEETLASLLVLTCTSIFFGDNQVKWRTHLYEAKRVVMNQLKRKLGRKKAVLHYNVMGDEHDFLGRWFTYYDVVSCLSSADFIPESEVFSRVEVDFCPLTDVQLKQAMARLDDIQFVSGMEKNVLAYLAKVSRLVFMKLKGGSGLGEKALLVDAFELDYEILNYLEKGEQQRDAIFQSEFARDPEKLADPRIQDYKLLRVTNLIFGLTGVLLLRRRVMGMRQDSQMVKDLLIKVTNLINQDLGFGSLAEPSLAFCFFCCGCELVDPSLVSLRSIYEQRLAVLGEKGVACAFQAKSVMNECWRSQKLWWDVLKENNSDICFAI